jgi:phosphoglucosamine mutase
MARKFFGTDGVRGTANREPVTPQRVLALAMAAGAVFNRGSHRHRVVIGKDTRLSGYMLEPALTAGFTSVGMDVVLTGPVPTPAVGMLTRSMRADLGVMISASHNPYQDNGIKLFGPDGYKLSDAVEQEIEARMEAGPDRDRAAPQALGRARRLDDAIGRYIEFVKGSFPKELSLDGLKVVVDCAHGAAYKVAPTVLYELGAEVVPLGVSPDGFNINDGCGATAPEAMQQAVIEEGADLGIALDGDADRLILADETGEIVDGDRVMGLIAQSWLQTGLLRGGGVVATAMSNLALERFLGELGIGLERTAVGDRYVLERMRAGGFNLGGEQSGHIILSDYSTTGDGLIAALQVLAVVIRGGKPASEAVKIFTPLPQLLKSVRVNGTGAPLEDPRVKQALEAGERRLGATGRLFVRASGTEPLIRVMAEGEDLALVEAVTEEVAGEIAKAVGADDAE